MGNTELVERLERVEKANQRLWLAGGAMMLVLLGLGYIAAVMPEQIPEVIRARMFSVIDENGEVRFMMTDGSITHWDENGQMRAWMDVDGIRYYDENQQKRAHLGRVNLVTPSTEAETTYPAAVVLYDSESKVIWRAPPER